MLEASVQMMMMTARELEFRLPGTVVPGGHGGLTTGRGFNGNI